MPAPGARGLGGVERLARDWPVNPLASGLLIGRFRDVNAHFSQVLQQAQPPTFPAPRPRTGEAQRSR